VVLQPRPQGEPSERIDDQQYVALAVAKPLGDRSGSHRAAHTLERRTIRSSRDDHHLCSPPRVHQFADLASALANESNHDDVGLGMACNLLDQDALATSRTREYADALPSATR
jgi:hypothetical protein